MPVLVVVEVPGGSSELDQALMEEWNLADRPPEGNFFRLGGPMEGGWRVISLWESRTQFQQFLEERLHLTLQEAGDQQPTVSFWEVETVHRFE